MKEKEGSKTKKRTEEEEIEKQGRHSGWNAENSQRQIWLRCYHPWLSFLLGATVTGSNPACGSFFQKDYSSVIADIFSCERAHCRSTHFGRRPKYNSLPVAYLLRIFWRVSWEWLEESEWRVSWEEIYWTVGGDYRELAWSCFRSHTGYDLLGADKPLPHIANKSSRTLKFLSGEFLGAQKLLRLQWSIS